MSGICGVIMACGRWENHRGQHGGFRPVGLAPERATPQRVVASPPDILTLREIQVIQAAATGRTYAEVARDLGGISEQTVKNHIMAAHRKLDVGSTIEMFHKLGWLQAPELASVS